MKDENLEKEEGMPANKSRLRQNSQSLILRVLGIGFLISLILDVGVPLVTEQVLPLSILIPISLVLFISLLASSVVYMLKREWTVTIACIVLVLATLGYIALVQSGRGLVFAF